MLYKHCIAISQFITSVVVGFVIGLFGIEHVTGSLDFGFRLLLGVICALTTALAELYFLARKLNEDLDFDYSRKCDAKNK